MAAALASYLDARRHDGRWLLRIDDIDPPREQAGAADEILRTLDACALTWDGEVVFQSMRGEHYEQALARLDAAGLTFPCACTRKDLVGGVYPGTCRDGIPAGRRARTLRVRVDDGPTVLKDRIAGEVRSELAHDVGDFVLVRADGYYAYHLACVVDDAAAGVNRIVRGADLLDSTPRQIYLQRLLGCPEPDYAHIPVVVDEAGVKLSKQTFAPAVRPESAADAIFAALTFLRQDPPGELRGAPPRELIAWAVTNWQLDVMARRPPQRRDPVAGAPLRPGSRG